MLFRQIEYFQAIIETGNFYQAAEKCNVSQSAISQQIKKLEQELGVKLLDRHNRTFSLTPAGEHFYRKSLILVSDIEQIKRETKRIADNDHATLRIGYYKGYHGNELSEAVAEFSSKYPTVEVSIIVGSHEELYKALENDKLEVKVEKLKNENVASMVTLSEQSRRMQEMMKMYGMGGMDTGMFGGQASLILNADHPLVQYVVENKEGENVELICKQLYDLALLAHKPLSPQEMTAFVQRSNQIMMLLTK